MTDTKASNGGQTTALTLTDGQCSCVSHIHRDFWRPRHSRSFPTLYILPPHILSFPHPKPFFSPPSLCTCARHIQWDSYIPHHPTYLPVCVHVNVTYSGTRTSHTTLLTSQSVYMSTSHTVGLVHPTPPYLPPSLCTCQRHIQWYIPHLTCYFPVCVHVHVTYSGLVHPTPPLLFPSLCTWCARVPLYVMYTCTQTVKQQGGLGGMNPIECDVACTQPGRLQGWCGMYHCM